MLKYDLLPNEVRIPSKLKISLTANRSPLSGWSAVSFLLSRERTATAGNVLSEPKSLNSKKGLGCVRASVVGGGWLIVRAGYVLLEHTRSVDVTYSQTPHDYHHRLAMLRGDGSEQLHVALVKGFPFLHDQVQFESTACLCL